MATDYRAGEHRAITFTTAEGKQRTLRAKSGVFTAATPEDEQVLSGSFGLSKAQTETTKKGRESRKAKAVKQRVAASEPLREQTSTGDVLAENEEAR